MCETNQVGLPWQRLPQQALGAVPYGALLTAFATAQRTAVRPVRH